MAGHAEVAAGQTGGDQSENPAIADFGRPDGPRASASSNEELDARLAKQNWASSRRTAPA